MLTFKDFLTESLEVDKLKHLEHAEDHIIHGGDEGLGHAAENLEDLHNRLIGRKPKLKITTKYDGCLSGDTTIFTDKYGIISLQDLYQKWSMGDEIHTFGYYNGNIIQTKIIDKFARISNKKWLSLILENGEILKLTEDHEVMLKNGSWVKAIDLKENDDILSFNFS